MGVPSLEPPTGTLPLTARCCWHAYAAYTVKHICASSAKRTWFLAALHRHPLFRGTRKPSPCSCAPQPYAPTNTPWQHARPCWLPAHQSQAVSSHLSLGATSGPGIRTGQPPGCKWPRTWAAVNSHWPPGASPWCGCQELCLYAWLSPCLACVQATSDPGLSRSKPPWFVPHAFVAIQA